MRKTPVIIGALLLSMGLLTAEPLPSDRATAADEAVEIAYQIGIRKAQVDRLNGEIQQLSQQLQEKLKTVKDDDSATTETTATTGTLHVE